MDILLLNGVNLNTLGVREPEHYGTDSLTDITNKVKNIVTKNNLSFEHLQSNFEADLINKIHSANAKFIIINAAAWTHSSISLRDALLSVDAKFIEVHLSNVYKRENFRHKSYLNDIAIGIITGLGTSGYEFAAQYAIDYLNKGKAY